MLANVEIMRAFVRLRAMAGHSTDLARRLDALESKYDRQFKRRIGFVSEQSRAGYKSDEAQNPEREPRHVGDDQQRADRGR